jgi:hypothetical protein
MTDRLQRAFQSEKYGPEGEFLLSLSADDYQVVMHALVVAGSAIEAKSWEKGSLDTSLIYDDLHDRLNDWNHCDIEPYTEEET